MVFEFLIYIFGSFRYLINNLYYIYLIVNGFRGKGDFLLCLEIFWYIGNRNFLFRVDFY